MKRSELKVGDVVEVKIGSLRPAQAIVLDTEPWADSYDPPHRHIVHTPSRNRFYKTPLSGAQGVAVAVFSVYRNQWYPHVVNLPRIRSGEDAVRRDKALKARREQEEQRRNVRLFFADYLAAAITHELRAVGVSARVESWKGSVDVELHTPGDLTRLLDLIKVAKVTGVARLLKGEN